MRLAAVCIAVLALCLPAGAVRGAEENPVGPPVFAGTGVPAGAPEQILPAGAVLHLRLNNPAALIADLDRLFVSFVPARALPPEAQELLAQPQPLLALLGQRFAGQPLDLPGLAGLLGLDLARPATLTFYPLPPAEGFVLSLPVGDPELFAGFLAELLALRQMVPAGAGQPAHLVRTGLAGLPAVHVAVGPDRAYVCGSAALARSLAGGGAPDAPRLAAAALCLRALADYGDQDLVLVADPAFLKEPLNRFLGQYVPLPQPLLREYRWRIRHGLPPQMLALLDQRLRWDLGINGVEQGLDYLEALAVAAWEVLLPRLARQVLELDGLALAVDFGPQWQRGTLAVYAPQIREAEATRPLPLAEVRRALAALPGRRLTVEAGGRAPRPAASTLWPELRQRLEEKFREKGLDPAPLAAVGDYLEQRRTVAPLAARVDWTLTVGYNPPPAVPAAPPATFFQYLRQTLAGLVSKSTPRLTALPAAGEQELENFYRERAAAASEDSAARRRLLERLGLNRPFYDYACRFAIQATPGAARRLVFEDVYTTRGGLFGWSQHELINREIVYACRRQDLLLLQRGEGEDTWLNRLEAEPVAPLAPGLERLLDRVPEGACSLSTLRLLPQVADLLAGLGEAEGVLHRELEAYLAQVEQALRLPPGAAKRQAAEALARDLPFPVAAVCFNPRRGAYLLLPGNLVFPRPRLAPELAGLLEPFLRDADTLGGGLLSTRYTDGRLEVVVQQDASALALLVRSTVEAFHERFAATEEGQSRLARLLRLPGDGQLQPADVVLVNPFWMPGAGGGF